MTDETKLIKGAGGGPPPPPPAPLISLVSSVMVLPD